MSFSIRHIFIFIYFIVIFLCKIDSYAINVGIFTIAPSFRFKTEYNDNIKKSSVKIKDTILFIGPGVKIITGTLNTRMYLDLKSLYFYHFKVKEENEADGSAEAYMAYYPSKKFVFKTQYLFENTHEDYDEGITFTKNKLNRVSLSFNVEFKPYEKFSVLGKVNLKDINYVDKEKNDNSMEMDRSENNFELNFKYKIKSKSRILFNYIRRDAIYLYSEFDNTENEILLGFDNNWSKKLHTKILFGQIKRITRSATNYSTSKYNIVLDYFLTSKLKLLFGYDIYFQDRVLNNTSNLQKVVLYSLGFDKKIDHKTNLLFKYSTMKSDYEIQYDDFINDNSMSIDLKLKRKINMFYSLIFSYSLTKKDTASPTFSYTNNIISIYTSLGW